MSRCTAVCLFAVPTGTLNTKMATAVDGHEDAGSRDGQSEADSDWTEDATPPDEPLRAPPRPRAAAFRASRSLDESGHESG